MARYDFLDNVKIWIPVTVSRAVNTATSTVDLVRGSSKNAMT